MTRERWLRAVTELRTWKREGRRAVHKPLLLLWLLARARRGEPAEVSFQELDEPLARLLSTFGPPRKSHHPEFPFWHLQSDGVWVVRDADRLTLRPSGHSPSRRELLARDAAGAVPAELWAALADPKLRGELEQRILDEFWPETLHDDLRRAVGLAAAEPDEAPPAPEAEPQAEAEWETVTRRARDPAFRARVIHAYGGRCAACGFDAAIHGAPLAIEAAHVRWHCYDGPDTLDNALALCATHHAALDRGAIGIRDDLTLAVSRVITGGSRVREVLHALEGRPIETPAGVPPLRASYARWHAREVFRG